MTSVPSRKQPLPSNSKAPNTNATDVNLQAIEQEISKTGFELEHRVTTALRSARWQVIPSKYYVDAQSGTVREVDLVAYKFKKLGDISVCTALIVSCKKNADNAWVMLTRPLPTGDPNTNRHPVHTWTNIKPLFHQVSRARWPLSYYKAAAEAGGTNALKLPTAEVFAFQEMKRATGTPNNDRNIFASLTDLIKAQAYELEVLPERQSTPSIYQFNLLSVVDAPLVRLHYQGQTPKATEVEDEKHIARYIVKRRETFSRIHIVQAQAFDRVLRDYTSLHQANCSVFADEHTAFYKDIHLDHSRLRVFDSEFKTRLVHGFNLRLRRLNIAARISEASATWFTDNGLPIYIDTDNNTVLALGGDPTALKIAADALKDIYRYTGAFFFTDLPF